MMRQCRRGSGAGSNRGGNMAIQRVAIVSLVVGAMIYGCATVRKEDLDAWVGQPVSALETHPFFLTVPVVKTRASDGTEIWNYVNGANLSTCSGGGTVYAGRTVDFATYNQFTGCMSRFAACNNIFYFRDGRVTQDTPVGTGGMRCYTTEQLQPGFRGPANLR